MSRLHFLLPITITLLSGCGYVGEPLPPALKRPMRVNDLAAVERGARIIIQFTLPKETTEGLSIRDNPDVELRFGPSPGVPFRYEVWENASERFTPVPTNQSLAHVEIPAQRFIGKDLVVGVRVHGPHGRDIGWSNMVSVSVVTPLPAPQGLEAKDVSAGVRLEWHAPAPQFRVFRRLKGEPGWVQIGTTDKPFFVDTETAYGKNYEYFVQTIEKTGETFAESDVSETKEITPLDTYAPAIPTSLTAVPAAKSIELLWDRGAEKDLAGYRVYRDGKRITETLPSPAFSDKTIQPGKKFQYQVSAIDKAGNESGLSPAVEALVP